MNAETIIANLEAARRRDPRNVPISRVVDLIEDGSVHLWHGPNCAAVGEPLKDYHVWLAGGDLEELLELERRASAWAKAEGYGRMTIIGRRGWERVLPDYTRETMLVKRL